MGVDIYCNDIHTRCTYMGLQRFRLMLLKATLKYIENSKKELKTIYEKNHQYGVEAKYYENDYKTIMKYMRNLITTDSVIYSMPNYSKICKSCNNLLKLFDLYGVIIFVNHSDSDGYFTKGETFDILNSLQYTCMYMDYDDEFLEKYDDKPTERKIEDLFIYYVFKECADTGVPVSFM